MAGHSKNTISLDDVNQFISQEVDKRFSFNKFDLWFKSELSSTSQKAATDGKKEIPSETSASLQNTELYIESTFKAKQIELLNPGILLLNQLNDGPIKNLNQQLFQNSGRDREVQIEEDKINSLVQLENEHFNTEKAKINEELEGFESRKTDIQNRFDAKVSETGKEKPKHWNEYFCWGVIILLAFVEVPINSKVFEFFKLNRFETYITSGILILAFPILSHFSGLALHKNSSGKPNYKAAIPIFAFIIILCFVINLFRVDYIGQTGDEFGTGGGSISLGTILSSTSFWMAFLINVAIFICAIIMSYHMHDPDFEFETIYKEYKKQLPRILNEIEQHEQDLAGLEKVHKKKLGQLEAERAEVLKNIEAEILKLRNEYNNFTSAHDTVLQYLENLQDYMNQKYQAAIRHYRSQNQIYRKHQNPKYWDDQIENLPDLIADRGFSELNVDEEPAPAKVPAPEKAITPEVVSPPKPSTVSVSEATAIIDAPIAESESTSDAVNSTEQTIDDNNPDPTPTKIS